MNKKRGREREKGRCSEIEGERERSERKPPWLYIIVLNELI